MAGVARPVRSPPRPRTGTRSTTSTSPTRCRPTTRRRCSTRSASISAAAEPTRTSGSGAPLHAREAQTHGVLARLDPVRRAVFDAPAALGAAHRAGARGRPGRHRPGLAAAAPDAARAGRRLVARRGDRRPDDVFWLRRDEMLGGRRRLGSRGGCGRASARSSGGASGGPPRRSCCPKGTSLDGCSRGSCRRATAEQTGRRAHRHRRQRGAGHRARRGCSPARRTSAGCSRATCSSPASPRRPGPRCSRWRPAVVTDIGGPLSHSSIVAREYGIPAVLGTAVATRRIPDGASGARGRRRRNGHLARSPARCGGRARSAPGSRVRGAPRPPRRRGRRGGCDGAGCRRLAPLEATGPGSARVDAVCVDEHGGAPLLDHDPVVGRPVVMGAAGGGEDVPQELP